MEDLWAFNEEKVARAIFQCRTPVISAVGHETDTTIADYVADLRAPTPSAGAELAVADISQVFERMEGYSLAFKRLLEQKIREQKSRLEYDTLRLTSISPKNQIREKRLRLKEKEEALNREMEDALFRAKQRLAFTVERLEGVSPLRKLKQGYAYVAAKDGKRITKAEMAKPEELLQVYFSDGVLEARVEKQILTDGER